MQQILDSLNHQLQQILPDAQLAQTVLPDCAGLRLYLLDEHYRVDKLDSATAEQVMDNPLYWLFCWASGLVMAQQILAEPALVRGKTVLDVGSGSGVVAIAAAMAGAARVIASDLDPMAQQAITLNAALNGVSLEVIGDYRDASQQPDLITVADVLYDRGNLPLLDDLLRLAPVWLADSRIRNFRHAQLNLSAQVPGATFPSLGGFDEFSQVSIYQSFAG